MTQMATVYRVTLVHDTLENVKIVVEFSGRPDMSVEDQWNRALFVLRYPSNEFKMESAYPLTAYPLTSTPVVTRSPD